MPDKERLIHHRFYFEEPKRDYCYNLVDWSKKRRQLTQAEIDNPEAKPGMFQTKGEAAKTFGKWFILGFLWAASWYIAYNAAKLVWQWWG